MVFIIVVLVAIFYGLCIGGIIVEFKYVTDDFSAVSNGFDGFDGFDLLLALLIILFAPIFCIAGGVVCVYTMNRKSIEGSKEE